MLKIQNLEIYRNSAYFKGMKIEPIPVMTGKSIVTSFVISIIITVNEIVNLETPAKNEAAPISAIAPGSIHE